MKYDELFGMIPKPLMDKIFEYDQCEFAPDFLGFTEVYKALSMIIPKGKIIIDFGCNQAVQSWYFRNFAKYIGIDCAIPVEYRLSTDNSMYFDDEITHWIEFEFPHMNIDQLDCFAICSYVPDWGAQALIIYVRTVGTTGIAQ